MCRRNPGAHTDSVADVNTNADNLPDPRADANTADHLNGHANANARAHLDTADRPGPDAHRRIATDAASGDVPCGRDGSAAAPGHA